MFKDLQNNEEVDKIIEYEDGEIDNKFNKSGKMKKRIL